MDERTLESMGDAARAPKRLATEARDALGEQVERLTGRPLEAWLNDTRRWVRERPLQAVVLTIGVGFVLGKLLARD